MKGSQVSPVHFSTPTYRHKQKESLQRQQRPGHRKRGTQSPIFNWQALALPFVQLSSTESPARRLKASPVYTRESETSTQIYMVVKRQAANTGAHPPSCLWNWQCIRCAHTWANTSGFLWHFQEDSGVLCRFPREFTGIFNHFKPRGDLSWQFDWRRSINSFLGWLCPQNVKSLTEKLILFYSNRKW